MKTTAASVAGKVAELEDYLQNFSNLLIACSGGVDSVLLAVVANRVLGNRALAVTVRMPVVPTNEMERIGEIAGQFKLNHRFVDLNPLASVPEFAANPEDRCYYCKRAILAALRECAESAGIGTLADGSNLDDLKDYRPGTRALEEFSVLSPFCELGWNKEDIRQASRLLKLPTAEIPAAACLASRIPYGEAITPEKLRQIDCIETLLETHGFAGARARHHGKLLRIELRDKQFEQLGSAFRAQLATAARDVGFDFATIDVEPYRTGRLNETRKNGS